jgi:eukaryotic-like serine/threonine-protein kinase
MDRVRAKRMAEELRGKRVGGWTVLEFINHGKAALVFRASREREEAALKIFDPELVERFGRETQLGRIEREKKLIGKRHPHLIEIRDGGACTETDHCFIVMQYLPYKNLAEVLDMVPRDRIRAIIKQISDAAGFLESLEIVHRDIKPENIGISDDFENSVLMDLGVIRPIVLSKLTDQEGEKVFVGTLQYSPPELLYREEDHTVSGWRAVTFYQLGAVLHDLIMRKPIFDGHTQPFAKLVDAVKEIRPVITADDLDDNLILLAQSCLMKDPALRLKYIKWEDFSEAQSPQTSVSKIRERIRKRQAVSGSLQGINDEDTDLYARYTKLQEMVDTLIHSVRSICISDKECFPPLEIYQNISGTEPKASVTVCFRQSPKHSIYCTLSVFFSLHILDVRDLLLRIGFVALASGDCLRNDAIASSRLETLFEGTFQEKALEIKIERLLWSLIEEGQKIKTGDSEAHNEIKQIVIGLQTNEEP